MAQGNWNPEVCNASPRCRLCARVIRKRHAFSYLVSTDLAGNTFACSPVHDVCAADKGRTTSKVFIPHAIRSTP